MSKLFVDDIILSSILDDTDTQKQLVEDKVKYENEIQEYVENHYKAEDSKAMYALFNGRQRKLLEDFFKRLSVSTYEELNGTVDLQVANKKSKLKERMNNLADAMGMQAMNSEDWVYDGLVDTGKNNGAKCDLCPRPIRYAHFAVNKKTHECLKFGCNCASEFFNMDKTTMASLKTIQAQTLRDIKIIACIKENNNLDNNAYLAAYYRHMGGYVGQVFLENGVKGIQDLMTYSVKWKTKKEIVKKPDEDLYRIIFEDGRKDYKSLIWIKENIVSCINADLEDGIYTSLDERNLIPLEMSEKEIKQINNTIYIVSALKFAELGLAMPLSLMKKINSIASKVTRQHHPDYIKYAQELLISHNLAKSNLLKTAFTDFMVNYLASSVKACERDRELRLWNVRGPGTFCKVVILWETMITKLMAIKDVKSLITAGNLSEDELNNYLRRVGNNYLEIKPTIEKALKMFLVNKEVLRIPENIDEGFSKYMLKDVDEKLGVDLNKENGGGTKKGFSKFFTVDSVPYNIGLYYYNLQKAYELIINDSVKSIKRFLDGVELLDTDEKLVKYLCSIEITDKGLKHQNMDVSSYTDYTSNIVKLDTFLNTVSKADNEICKKVFKKYKKELLEFKKDCMILRNQLSEIAQNLRLSRRMLGSITANNINDDYEDLVVSKKKSNKEYFQDYCELLVARRANKSIQAYVNSKNLRALSVFKQLNKYSDMFIDIQQGYEENFQKEENMKFFESFGLKQLKEYLESYLSLNLDEFILTNIFEICKANNILKDNYLYYKTINKVDGSNKDNVLKEYRENIPESILLDVFNKYQDVFQGLYSSFMTFNTSLMNGMSMCEYYALINNNDISFKKELKANVFVISEFRRRIKEIHGNYIEYPKSYSFNYSDFITTLGYFKDDNNSIVKVKQIITELLDTYTKKKEEQDKIIRDKADNVIKNSIINNIVTYLDEHIKFFEITKNDINDYYSKNPLSVGKKSEASIRRNLAFKNIHYESSYEMLPHFISAIKQSVTNNNIILSVGDKESIKNINSLLTNKAHINISDAKTYVAILSTICYNNNLIYNHLIPCYEFLKLFKTLDFSMLSDKELEKVEGILKIYYLLSNDVNELNVIAEKYGVITNLKNEIMALPKPNQIDSNSVVTNNPIDSTGLSGVDKAKKLFSDPKFGTLHSTVQSIVKNVCSHNSCTAAQLNSINKAYEKLEYVPKGTYTNQNTIDNVDTTVKPKDIKKEGFEKIALLKAHPDYDSKIPERLKSIIETMEKRDMCTSAQLYNINKGLDLLGIKM